MSNEARPEYSGGEPAALPVPPAAPPPPPPPLILRPRGSVARREAEGLVSSGVPAPATVEEENFDDHPEVRDAVMPDAWQCIRHQSLNSSSWRACSNRLWGQEAGRDGSCTDSASTEHCTAEVMHVNSSLLIFIFLRSHTEYRNGKIFVRSGATLFDAGL